MTYKKKEYEYIYKGQAWLKCYRYRGFIYPKDMHRPFGAQMGARAEFETSEVSMAVKWSMHTVKHYIKPAHLLTPSTHNLITALNIKKK